MDYISLSFIPALSLWTWNTQLTNNIDPVDQLHADAPSHLEREGLVYNDLLYNKLEAITG